MCYKDGGWKEHCETYDVCMFRRYSRPDQYAEGQHDTIQTSERAEGERRVQGLTATVSVQENMSQSRSHLLGENITPEIAKR